MPRGEDRQKHAASAEAHTTMAETNAEPTKADVLKAKLETCELQPEFIRMVDTSDGCGSKFEAIIVSAKFDGMALLERQQAVNTVLADDMPGIHALSMKTWTPAQYEKKKADL